MPENELEEFAKELNATYNALLAVVNDLNARLDSLEVSSKALSDGIREQEKSLDILISENGYTWVN